MQLLGDALSVLGSRHGLIFDPHAGTCRLLRFDAFAEAPVVELRAGLVVNGKAYHFPLCPDGERFAFFDQRLTPCTTRFIGIEPHTGLKASLEIVTPFRPRDATFSTTPVLGLRLGVERLSGNFRWTPDSAPVHDLELFIEIAGADLRVEPAAGTVDLFFSSRTARTKDWYSDPGARVVPQHDRLVAPSGEVEVTRFRLPLDPAAVGAAWVIDRVAGRDETAPRFPDVRVPRLFDAQWPPPPRPST